MINRYVCFVANLVTGLFFVTMLAACIMGVGNKGAIYDPLVSYWQEISLAEVRGSVLDEGGYVKAVRQKQGAGQHLLSQAFLLQNGSMIYEEQGYARHGAFPSPAEQIVRRYSKHSEIVSRKVSILEDDVERKTSSGSDIYFTDINSQSLSCFLIFRYSADSDVGLDVADEDAHYYQAITGSFCAMPGHDGKENLQSEMISFVENVFFDDGDFVRKQITPIPAHRDNEG
jgi:hypothetical protein